MNITVVGQGYVGLPLAIKAAESGFTVYGLDDNLRKISILQSGKSVSEDLNDEVIKSGIDSKRYIPTSNSSCISQSEIIIICVPTPLTKDRKPDLTFLIKASKDVAHSLTPNSLVIIESTVEPGTCRNLILPQILEVSKLDKNEIDFAYSPERIDPANLKWRIDNTPKLLAGFTESAFLRAEKFYRKFITSIIKCSSLEIAETAKLLENTFRLINISFVNELSIFCQKYGIDINEVVSAAATKPYGFMPFYPSIGAGGHCIPVDPIYLANAAKAVGAPSRFIELADQVNQDMPGYFVGRAAEILGSLKGKNVLVVGVSYKPNVADVRETPVEALILELKKEGAEVCWHDDLVKEWNNEKSMALSNKYDLAILATLHDYIDLTKLRDVPILNTRGSI